jgi:hypothetical protein
MISNHSIRTPACLQQSGRLTKKMTSDCGRDIIDHIRRLADKGPQGDFIGFLKKFIRFYCFIFE